MESTNAIYKEMLILKLEDLALQNNFLFVMINYKKSLSTNALLIINFTKLQTTIAII